MTRVFTPHSLNQLRIYGGAGNTAYVTATDPRTLPRPPDAPSVSHMRLDALDATDALALTLLAHAACFAPGEPTPRSLLPATLGPASED